MKYLERFKGFEIIIDNPISNKLKDSYNEGHATLKPGALIEFHVPDTNKNHIGKIISIESDHMTVLDLKTEEEIRLPRKECGPSYEN